MSRIKFPIGGQQNNSGIINNWSKKNWQMIKQPAYNVDTTMYKVVFSRNDSAVFERVYLPNSGFDFQCRFKLIHGKWFLVYCLDQNL
jgi:hypothetical protein